MILSPTVPLLCRDVKDKANDDISSSCCIRFFLSEACCLRFDKLFFATPVEIF
jgi:hypothetical protein